jgi:hypothetical protein
MKPFHAAIVAHQIDTRPAEQLDARRLWTRLPRDARHALSGRSRSRQNLAWLDWALGEAFVGPDGPVVTPADATHVDWDHAVLHITPTLDHRAIATNAPAIWAALAASETPPPAMPLPESGALIVWRDHHASRFRAIDRNELQALLLVRSGIGFAELCAELVTSLGENDGIACAGACLGRWIGDGMISRITTQDG